MYVVNAAEMKRLDICTMQKFGMSQMVLMERAALVTQEEIKKRKYWKSKNAASVLIVAGNGNNGGDGLALGRLFLLDGLRVTVLISGEKEKYSDAMQKQLDIYKAYGGKLSFYYNSEKKLLVPPESYAMVVDALFGTGLSRKVEGNLAELIQWMNQCKTYKVAMDIPSGISSDTGNVLGEAFRADLTVSYAYTKCGCLLYPGRELCGELCVRDIGISDFSFLAEEPCGFTYERSTKACSLLPERNQNSHKGTYGKVVLIAGSRETPGAAILAGKAVLRSGAGMLKMIMPESNREMTVKALPEALLGVYQNQEQIDRILQESATWCDCIVAGPGIGKGPQAYYILKWVLQHTFCPLILDADALNILAEDADLFQKMVFRAQKGHIVICTPHMGELGRLLHVPIMQLQQDRIMMLENFCKSTSCILVSKDAATVVGCFNQSGKFQYYINQSGNSGMATAGSGDVLAGIIGAFVAAEAAVKQKERHDMYCKAAIAGVYLHGCAGDYAAGILGEVSIVAGDLIKFLSPVLQDKTKIEEKRIFTEC